MDRRGFLRSVMGLPVGLAAVSLGVAAAPCLTMQNGTQLFAADTPWDALEPWQRQFLRVYAHEGAIEQLKRMGWSQWGEVMEATARLRGS